MGAEAGGRAVGRREELRTAFSSVRSPAVGSPRPCAPPPLRGAMLRAPFWRSKKRPRGGGGGGGWPGMAGS